MIKLSRRRASHLRSTSSCAAIAGLFMGVCGLSLSTPALADSAKTTVYDFAGEADGWQPQTGLTTGPDGNFYGTTSRGGKYDGGTVYQLSPNGGGGWTHKIILSLTGFKDGAFPNGPLTFDSQGNLYGTSLSDGIEGHGAVFQLVKDEKGHWKLGRHYRFKFKVGSDIFSGVVVDTHGNVFGMAHYGGKGNVGHGYGTIYELSPGQGDTYIPTVLHTFDADTPDGGFPNATLIMNTDGDLFGVTASGGAYHQRYAFKFHQNIRGRWIITDIHDFDINVDGEWPDSTMTMDGQGNLYGGTSHSPAIVYKLSPPRKATGDGKAQWTETTLFQFPGGDSGGGLLSFDPAGHLLGTSGYGGPNDAGYAYTLSPTQSGPWTQTVLYNFQGGTDGKIPLGPLVLQNGLLYGATNYGGVGSDKGVGNGTIFSLTYP